MKKIFSMLLMGMMLMGMTSCLDNNENNETNFTLSMYNRTVTMGSEDVSEFNVNNAAFKINYTNSTISVNAMATVGKDNTIQFKIDDMQLTADQGMQLIASLAQLPLPKVWKSPTSEVSSTCKWVCCI